MKHVLFLAPSYNYMNTVIDNLEKDLKKNNIRANYSRSASKPSVLTDEVEVKFVTDDPAKWRFDGYRFDEVFGKKELVEVFRRLCPGRFVNTNKKTSLSHYIISQSTNVKECSDEYFPHGTHNGMYVPDIKKVHFNYPHTIVLWSDGTKTMVKCQEGDFYDNTVGLAMAISKKALGNAGNYYNTFKKHLPKEEVCDGVPAQE